MAELPHIMYVTKQSEKFLDNFSKIQRNLVDFKTISSKKFLTYHEKHIIDKIILSTQNKI